VCVCVCVCLCVCSVCVVCAVSCVCVLCVCVMCVCAVRVVCVCCVCVVCNSCVTPALTHRNFGILVCDGGHTQHTHNTHTENTNITHTQNAYTHTHTMQTTYTLGVCAFGKIISGNSVSAQRLPSSQIIYSKPHKRLVLTHTISKIAVWARESHTGGHT